MPTARIPLIGSFSSRDALNSAAFGTSQKDQYFEDCHFQVVTNPASRASTVWVMARNEFAEGATPGGTGDGTCIRFWRGHPSPGLAHVLTAFGDTNSTIYDAGSSLGAITGQCIHMNETSISGTATALFVSASNKAYYYPAGGSLTEITDGQFPSNNSLTITGNFAVLDGFHFIMATNGTIWHSDVNSIANWTSTATISVQEYPDPGVGVERWRNFIVGLSKDSTEFFINAGNATGATLSRVQNMACQVGCMSQHSICRLGEAVVWAGHENGQVGVFMLSTGKPERISTPEIDYFIQNSEPSELRINAMVSYGKIYLALHRGDSKNLHVFDPSLRLWHPWTLTDSLTKSDAPGDPVSTSDTSGGVFYVGGDQPNIIYNAVVQAATATIQTSVIDFGTMNRKTLHRLRIVGDKASEARNLTVSWSDNDYQSFSTGRTINMADAMPRLDRCGIFRRRAIKITGLSTNGGANNEPLRLEALEFDYEVASS
jgi:hypothetical protein